MDVIVRTQITDKINLFMLLARILSGFRTDYFLSIIMISGGKFKLFGLWKLLAYNMVIDKFFIHSS